MKAIFVLIAAVAFAISPFLNPEFGGFDPERYPVPQNDPPVQPAGYAFGIWGVIYLWLILHAGYGFWRHRDNPAWDETRVPLLISLGVGAFWLPVALVSPLWATLMIWVMCVSALYATFLSCQGSPNWALSLPLGLYAGWLTAASFVATGLLLAGYGTTSETAAAWIMVLAAMAVALTIQQAFQAVWTYGLAAGWGLIAIAVKNWGDQSALAIVALTGAVVILALAGRQVLQTRR